MFTLLTSLGGVGGVRVVDRWGRAGCFVDCCLIVCWHSPLPLGLLVCVDGEGVVDCEFRADFLLSGGSAAVGG